MQANFSLNNSISLVKPWRVAIIGGGPAGLMAAEVLASAGPGLSVQVYDAMPSVGRKFLLAGKGGLNLTHSEAPQAFMSRYGERGTQLQRLGPNAGCGDIRWQLGPCISQRHESRPAVARLAAPSARRRGAVLHATSLAGLG
jgi:hypothetical protein